MKYIIFSCLGTPNFPIVFPEHIDHSMIARCVQSEYPGYEPSSAGFCSAAGSVWGESVTLKLKALSEDAWYIRKLFGIGL